MRNLNVHGIYRPMPAAEQALFGAHAPAIDIILRPQLVRHSMATKREVVALQGVNTPLMRGDTWLGPPDADQYVALG